MIKVLGESKKHLKHADCPNCNAELEYTKSDIKEQHGRDYSGGADGKEWITCPRCHHDVILRRW